VRGRVAAILPYPYNHCLPAIMSRACVLLVLLLQLDWILAYDDDGLAIGAVDSTALYYYLAYFIGLYVIMAVMDWVGVADSYVKALGDVAFASFQKHKGPLVTVDEQIAAAGGSLLEQVASTIQDIECLLPTRSAGINAPSRGHGVARGRDASASSAGQQKPGHLSLCCQSAPDEPYSDEFFASLLTRTTYYGISTSGLLQEALLFMCNHNTILSTFMSIRGAPFSRHAKRVAFLVQNCVVFFFSVVITAAFKTESVYSIIFNIFVVAPFSLLVHETMYYTLACPCLARCHHSSFCCICVKTFQCMGRLIAYPMVLIGIALLVLASVLSVSHHAGALVAKFAFSVHLETAALELFFTLLAFWSAEVTVSLQLCGCLQIFQLGKVVHDKIAYLGLQESRDYVVSRKNLLVVSAVVTRLVGHQDPSHHQQHGAEVFGIKGQSDSASTAPSYHPTKAVASEPPPFARTTTAASVSAAPAIAQQLPP
jgi:hypothetical protein